MDSAMHNDAGHLTVLGWGMFALYALATLCSIRARMVSFRQQPPAQAASLWTWLGIILAALGLNKVIDLQTRLIELGRRLASRETLSAHGAQWHLLFFVCILMFFGFFAAVVYWRRQALKILVGQFPLVLAGCLMIAVYILVRAIAIVRVEQMLGMNWDQIPFLWLLEAGGLLLIISQALFAACKENRIVEPHRIP